MMSWGIKELIVAAKLCHPYCETCYDGTSSGCLSCASGYYLQGNVCRKSCNGDMYQISDLRSCVSTCPSYYYSYVDSNTNVKSCQKCQSGCMICSGSNICQAWENQEAYVPNTWSDKIQFWVLLIIVVLAILSFVIYKVIEKLMKKPNELQEKLHEGSNDDSGEKKTEKK